MLNILPSKQSQAAGEGGAWVHYLGHRAWTCYNKGYTWVHGYHLHSANEYRVVSMEITIVKTDIQITQYAGCFVSVASCSGLSPKHVVDVAPGVIDEDYGSSIGVVLFNFGKGKFEVKNDDHMAQHICEWVYYPEIEEVQGFSDAKQGSKGFGSTGKN
ncbi:deoxyuridine 5'-triphosphate nucleotidohydrolase, mitochondrial-like [Phyllostomus hastatus]|uniref:deoxyuridine 5'-triphosphate nucleotidohydrolase, mitochondrial-like n=1 Tax=Phyllostomus hastatus TaxID=9423 RepID=UPI001E68114D|nr:deoxyuridine 5'-triphosphate nucleotidohydrolase, mitochondrial-like [Phyllostomus hastatus]